MLNAVARKGSILFTIRDALYRDPQLLPATALLDDRILRTHAHVRSESQRWQAYCDTQNRKLLLFWMAPVIAIFLALLLGMVSYNYTRGRVGDPSCSLTVGHWAGLLLVFFSYVPELLFFLFVIERHVPMGGQVVGASNNL